MISKATRSVPKQQLYKKKKKKLLFHQAMFRQKAHIYAEWVRGV
jgi:hypothetical protein